MEQIIEEFVAIIPIRKGSKGIKNKNTKVIGGFPLFIHSVLKAVSSEYIQKVYVSTDIPNIKVIIKKTLADLPERLMKKIIVVDRPLVTCSDFASTESVLMDFALKFAFKYLVLIQATNPFLSTIELNEGIEKVMDKRYDSIISLVESKRFHWKQTNNNYVESTNYDIFNRPQRQFIQPHLIENGSFYITSKEALTNNKCRISGNIGYVIMNKYSIFEIDEKLDWIIAKNLLERKEELFSHKIKFFIDDTFCSFIDVYPYQNYNNIEKIFEFFMPLEKANVGIILIINGAVYSYINGKISIKERNDSFNVTAMGVITELQKKGVNCKEISYSGSNSNEIEKFFYVGMSFSPNFATTLVKKVSNYVINESSFFRYTQRIIDIILKKNKVFN